VASGKFFARQNRRFRDGLLAFCVDFAGARIAIRKASRIAERIFRPAD